MESDFFKSEGINQRQLKLIIGLICVRLLVGLYNSFGISDSITAYHILNIFFKICDIIILFYLYKFVGVDLKQKLFLFLFVLLILVNVYGLFTAIYMLLQSFISDAPVYSIFTNQFYNYIPMIVVIPAEIIIAIQLISNDVKGDLQPAIKFVGMASLIQLIGMIIIIAIQQVLQGLLTYYSFVYFVLFSLSYVAMIYMYVTALKADSSEEVI